MSEHDHEVSKQRHDVDMLDEYDFSQAKQGPVVSPAPGKTRITIRLDTDILQWFHDRVNAQGGGSYQALINQALRLYIMQTSMALPIDNIMQPHMLGSRILPQYGVRTETSDVLREIIRQIVREELARST
jgi:uncharacterized protein (DUF4415 family)